MVLLLAACGTSPEPGGDAGDTVDTGPVECAPFEDAKVEKDPGRDPWAARVITGELTTTLDFDAEAEALGFVDCAYTRSYPALVEVADLGWICPDCAWYTKGEATVVEGYSDCYRQISDADATRVEHLGFATGEAGTTLWRSGVENVAMADTTAVVDAAVASAGGSAAVAYASESPMEGGGNVTLSVAGAIEVSVSDVLVVADPARARTEPYACGWPLQSPGGPVPTWAPAVGEIFPNARLRDTCGEEVDLWDFRGRYVVLDAASPDCGPCQAMAATAEAFKAAMAAQCIRVETITLLNDSLGAVNKAPSDRDLNQWVRTFDLASPVLADEGFGYGVVGPLVSDGDGMSLPSAVVIDPEGRLLGGDHGYSDDDGGWDRYGRFILEDVAARAAAP